MKLQLSSTLRWIRLFAVKVHNIHKEFIELESLDTTTHQWLAVPQQKSRSRRRFPRRITFCHTNFSAKTPFLLSHFLFPKSFLSKANTWKDTIKKTCQTRDPNPEISMLKVKKGINWGQWVLVMIHQYQRIWVRVQERGSPCKHFLKGCQSCCSPPRL